MLRLLPAVAALLFLYALLVDWREAAIVAVYGANWARAFDLYPMKALGHCWSLSIEEQFYLVWPLLLLLILRSGLGKRATLVIIAIGIIACGAWRAVITLQGATKMRVYNGLDTKADALLVGCLLGLLFAWRRLPKDSVWVRVAGAGSVAFFLACVPFDRHVTSTFFCLGGFTLVACASAALIVNAMNGRGIALLEHPVLLWIGRRSYGIYLWHYPLIWWFTAHTGQLARRGVRPGLALLISIVLSFVAAALSFRFIEQPFLRMKPTRQPSGARVARRQSAVQ